MSFLRRPPLALVAVAAVAVASTCGPASAAPKTVCTITVNSPDEKEVMQRQLPPGDYRFVELVEHGRADWLASACRQDIRCDVLVVSGHFDGGEEFYSDRLDVRESLPVAELERASCSDSCPAVFAQLKEVYLFGCNTLNADPLRSASGEIPRSLARAGYAPGDVERMTRGLIERYADSNRDRMRHIFKDVPVIYGFSSKAPLGASAGPALQRYLQGTTPPEIGSGKPSARLLAQFAAVSMTSTPGLKDGDPTAAARADACRFVDDRLATAQRLAFVHELLDREAAESRLLLDSIERLVATLTPADRAKPEVASVLRAITEDRAARDRFLAFARDADQPAIRARMIEVAHRLGWLDATARRAELGRMLADVVHSGATPADVGLACALNEDGALADQVDVVRGRIAGTARVPTGAAAVLACLGSAPDRARVLAGMTEGSDADVEIAQVYLQHRPLDDAQAIRAVARGVARMSDASAQARVLDALSRYTIDTEALGELAALYEKAKSVGVQRAIAGIIIRSDYRSIASAKLVQTLRQHRLKSGGEADVIDVLLRRLAALV